MGHNDLYEQAKRLIPGGTQLLSKRPEMFLPGGWPAYYSRAKGCEVWDLDDRRYVDMSLMGIGACVLGYADEDVDAAVHEAIERGNMATLNAPEEVELAEILIGLHPWADAVRYARTGGEAMAVAVRIARAHTRRDKVLFCGYHGWHDWYLAANLSDDEALDGHLLPGLEPRGVPRALKGTAFPFSYNDAEGFLSLMDEHGQDVGAVVMEPLRDEEPAPGFLEMIREETRTRGIVLVVDEITAGWRLCVGGAHLCYDFEPDIAVFAKAMSNGYPMAAVIGRGEVMRAAQETFVSSTYWTERIGPSAALATIRKLGDEDVPALLSHTGRAVKEVWISAAGEAGLDVHVGGLDPLVHLSFEHPEALALKTLFTQEMLDRGFLATTAFYASFAHREEHVEAYANVCREVLRVLADALSAGDIVGRLRGPVCHAGFKRLT
ncbi:MAG: aminotransferase class III-fold pyridoxal phosphate-dependent enzyme [Deltaproteobacteria bacterium]|nr:aminotransferase class III-fold pyridoxal phosphate-dependent enzyme [Deltaproteobacteria bacterium]